MVCRFAAAVLLNAGLAQGSSVITDVSHGDHFDLDVAKVKVAAKRLLVDGEGTSKDGSGWLESVDSIDRNLVVHWDIAETDAFEDTTDKHLTCDKAWKCADTHYEICPNMALTTAQVRGFVNVPADLSAMTSMGVPWGQSGFVFPTFEFNVVEGKKYSILLVDLSKKGDSDFIFFPHSVVLSMEDNKVSTAAYKPGFLPSANPDLEYNHYTFLLFEHTVALSGPYAGDEADLKALMTKVGLKENMLVAVNWYRAKASVASFIGLDALGLLVEADRTVACDSWTGNDMCDEELDTVCADFVESSAGKLMVTLFTFASMVLHIL
jgi:hypothetical protein